MSQYLCVLGSLFARKRDALAKWDGKRIAGVELVTAGRIIVAIEPAAVRILSLSLIHGVRVRRPKPNPHGAGPQRRVGRMNWEQ